MHDEQGRPAEQAPLDERQDRGPLKRVRERPQLEGDGAGTQRQGRGGPLAPVSEPDVRTDVPGASDLAHHAASPLSCCALPAHRALWPLLWRVRLAPTTLDGISIDASWVA